MDDRLIETIEKIKTLVEELKLDQSIIGKNASDPGLLFELKVVKRLLDVSQHLQSFEIAGRYIAQAIVHHPGTNTYILGPGYHSTMAMIEATYRSAGLACFIPIVYQGLNIEVGGILATQAERTPNIIRQLFDDYRVRENDTLVLNNQYGINQMTIEAAKEAIERRVFLVAWTSRDYGDNLPAQHEARYRNPEDGSQGVNLFELVADYKKGVYCECGTPYRDGILTDVSLGGNDAVNKVLSPFSTIAIGNAHGLTIAYTIMALRELGYDEIDDVVVQSANAVGGTDMNKPVQEKWPWQFRSPQENMVALQKMRSRK